MITEGDCAICCERLSSGPLSVTVPCGHVFHRDCVAKWDATSRDRITDCTGAGRAKCAICGNFTDTFIDLYIDLEKDGAGNDDEDDDDISLSSCESCGCNKKMESSVVDILSQRPNDLEFMINNDSNGNNNNSDKMLCIEEKHLDLVALRHSAITSQLSLDASMEKLNKKAKAKKAQNPPQQGNKNILQNNNLSPSEKTIALHKQTRQLKRKIRKLQSLNSQKQRTIIEQQHTQSMLITIKKQYLQAKQHYEQAKSTEKRYCLELAEARLESAAAVRQVKQIESQLQSLRNDQLQLLAKREQAYIEMSHLKRQHKLELEKAQDCGIEEIKELRRDHPKLIQENADLRRIVLDKERTIERLKGLVRMNDSQQQQGKASSGMNSTGATAAAAVSRPSIGSYSSSDNEEADMGIRLRLSDIRKKFGNTITSTSAAASSSSISSKKRPAAAALPSSSSRSQKSSLSALNVASKAYKTAKMAQQRRTLLHENGNFTPSLIGRTLQSRKPPSSAGGAYGAPAPASFGSLFSDENINRRNNSSSLVDLCGSGGKEDDNDRSTENEIIDLLGGDNSGDDASDEEGASSSAAVATSLAFAGGNTATNQQSFLPLPQNNEETMLPMMSISIPTSISQNQQNKRRKFSLSNFGGPAQQEQEEEIAPSFSLFASAPTPAAAVATSSLGRDSLGSQASDSSIMASAVAASASVGGGDLGGIMRYCAKPDQQQPFSLTNSFFGSNNNGTSSNNSNAYASISSSSNNNNMMQNNTGTASNSSSMFSSSLLSSRRNNDIRNFFAS